MKRFWMFFLLTSLLVVFALVSCGDDDDDDNDDSSDDDDVTDDDDDSTLPGANVTVNAAPDTNPLCRNLIVTTDEAVSLSGYVTAEGETGYGPSEPTASDSGTEHDFWFYGLLEDTTFTYTFYIAGQPDQVVATGTFHQDAAPEARPEIQEFTSTKSDATDWVSVWGIDALTWDEDNSNITITYDRQGRVRFYHSHPIEHSGWNKTADDGTILFGNWGDILTLAKDGTEDILVDVQAEDPFFVARHHEFYIDDYDDYANSGGYVLYNELRPGVKCDLSTPTDTMAGDGVLQIDASGNELWRWNIFDHLAEIPVTEMEPANCALYFYGPQYPDFTHANSVVPGPNENEITVSFRNIMRILKIDLTTGDILWQMGPNQNDFEWIGEDAGTTDEWFRFAHDVKWLSPTRLLLFDNGVCRYQPFCLLGAWSRALELEVNETDMTIEMVWEHRVPFAAAQGNVERHENGNTLIGVGGGTWVIEATPDGEEIFTINFNLGVYRATYYPPLWIDDDPPGK
jgi:Arylsulfotransferase (ASST)